ncbi:MAG: membrane protein insertion efficiency factor YidD [Streptosporangiaceae bacterium]
MKAAVLGAIEAWQANPNRPRGLCRQAPTCSVYGHQVIMQYGVVRGGLMTAWRVFRCNPCLAAAARNSGQAAA